MPKEFEIRAGAGVLGGAELGVMARGPEVVVPKGTLRQGRTSLPPWMRAAGGISRSGGDTSWRAAPSELTSTRIGCAGRPGWAATGATRALTAAIHRARA